MYPLSEGAGHLSSIVNIPMIPIAIVAIPIMAKIITQLCARLRSKAINPPNTARMATRGIIELIPSAEPRLVESVESVSHALYAASFADEPKKVIRQSRTIVSVMPIAAALDAAGKRASITSSLSSANAKIEIPQRI